MNMSPTTSPSAAVSKSDFYSRITRVKQAIDKVASLLCIAILGAMTLLVTWQVASRYLLNSPSAISEVLARYLFIWLVLIGGAYVFGLREHMAITFLRDKLPRKLRLSLEIIGELATTIFAFLVLTLGGYIGMNRQMAQLDSALQIPIGVIYIAIPLSGAMTLFYCLYNQYGLFRQFSSKHD
ncbi:MAG: TRAP transporter small permease [Leclercia sp.]